MKLLIPLLNIFMIIPVLAGNDDEVKQSAPPLEELHGLTLDISADDNKGLAFFERKLLDSIDYQQIKARNDTRVTKFVDGHLNIWENPVKPFSSAAIVYDYGEPRLMFVEESEGGGKKFFAKIFSTWTPITDSDYNERVKAIRDQIPIISQFPLNIRFKHENPKYVVEKYPKQYANLFIFTPTKHHRAKVVHDGKNILWKATIPTERCPTVIAYSKGNMPLIAHLFIVSDHKPMSYLFMKKVNEKWVEITERQFHTDILTLKFESSSFKPVTLDINSVDGQVFEVEPCTFEFPYFRYVPRGEYKITKVVDGDKLIWKSQDPNSLYAYSVGHYNKRGPPIIQLFVNHNAPRFRYNYILKDGEWEPTSDFNVDNRYYTMQNERYKILDVSEPNHQDASIIELTMNKVRYFLITPKLGSDIMLIRDNKQTIWRYEGLNEYFVNGWLYFFQSNPVLLHFRVRNALMEHYEFYFIKRDGYWDRGNKEEYLHMLNVVTESTKKGLSVLDEDMETATEYDNIQPIQETQTTSDETEPVSKSEFKEKLYSQYGLAQFESDDEEITKVIPSAEIKPPSYAKSPYTPKESQFESFPELEDLPEEDDEKLGFEHVEPEQVIDYIDLDKMDPRKACYKSMDDIHTYYEEEFHPRFRNLQRISKSYKDITRFDRKEYSTPDDKEDIREEKKKPVGGKKPSKKPKLRTEDSFFIPSTALILFLSIVLSL